MNSWSRRFARNHPGAANRYPTLRAGMHLQDGLPVDRPTFGPEGRDVFPPSRLQPCVFPPSAFSFQLQAFKPSSLRALDGRAAMTFVHLHNHSDFSLLDGALRIPELVGFAKQQGMPAVALTDHGNMFGMIDFINECKAKEIKPIPGQEFYITEVSRHDRGRDNPSTTSPSWR